MSLPDVVPAVKANTHTHTPCLILAPLYSPWVHSKSWLPPRLSSKDNTDSTTYIPTYLKNEGIPSPKTYRLLHGSARIGVSTIFHLAVPWQQMESPHHADAAEWFRHHDLPVLTLFSMLLLSPITRNTPLPPPYCLTRYIRARALLV